MNKKIEFINGAYSRMRVSGLTKQPDGSDVQLALNRLEMMAAVWQKKNIATGYNFEDEPDPNSPHNVPIEYWSAYESNLAMSLLSDFGKQATPTLMFEAAGSLSALYAATAQTTQVQYPNRQPVGKGNRFNRWQRYYSNQGQLEVDSRINDMKVGNVNDFSEHFDAYLGLNEIISSFTINSSQPTKLLITNQVNTDNDVNFRATALGVDTVAVIIVITTDLGRVETQNVVFRITEV